MNASDGGEAQEASGLELRDVRREYRQGDAVLHVLKGVDLQLQPGEIVALVGPSGAGKSTLLQIAGLLDRPDAGQVLIGGIPTDDLDDDGMSGLRRTGIGFVFQFHHLLPEFDAAENVMLPQMIAGVRRGVARERAEELLALVGLAERTRHRPSELSGGEQQRVAIARALANHPSVLLADEPTGNLDYETADHVMGALVRLVYETRVGALVATHNLDLARRMDRIVRLDGGRLVNGLPP